MSMYRYRWIKIEYKIWVCECVYMCVWVFVCGCGGLEKFLIIKKKKDEKK